MPRVANGEFTYPIGTICSVPNCYIIIHFANSYKTFLVFTSSRTVIHYRVSRERVSQNSPSTRLYDNHGNLIEKKPNVSIKVPVTFKLIIIKPNKKRTIHVASTNTKANFRPKIILRIWYTLKAIWYYSW